jgi:hypothetical protein
MSRPLQQNNIETCGALIRNQHPALADFPTRSFADFQWHNFMRPGRAFILNDAKMINPSKTFSFSREGRASARPKHVRQVGNAPH